MQACIVNKLKYIAKTASLFSLPIHRYVSIYKRMMRRQLSVAHLLFVTLHLCPVPVELLSYNIHDQEDWSAKFKQSVGSQVQVIFMPGIYEVSDDTFISNVNNFSITGNNSTASHVIFSCSNLSSWIIANSSHISIKNIKFFNCGNKYDVRLQPSNEAEIKATVVIYNTSFVSMINVIMEDSCGYGIIALNIVGLCTFERIIMHGSNNSTFCYRNHTVLGGMALLNLKDVELLKINTVINIKRCLFTDIQAIQDDEIKTPTKYNYLNSSMITIFLYHFKYHIDVSILNVSITNVTIAKGSVISIAYSTNSTSNVTLANVLITHTIANYSIVKINYIEITATFSKFRHTFFLSSCKIYCNKAVYVFRMIHSYDYIDMKIQLKNNIFNNNTVIKTLFRTKGVVPFILGYSNFSNNEANVVFSVTRYVLMEEGSVFSFVNNWANPWTYQKYTCLFKKDNIDSPDCPFQFINTTNVSIIFNGNTGYYRAVYGNVLFGCIWNSNFPNKSKLLPNEIFNQIIHYTGDEIKGISGWENSVCPCSDAGDYNENCLSVKSYKIYPGETISIRFRHSYFDIAMYTDFNASMFNSVAPACGIYGKNATNPKIDLIFEHCTITKYIIASNLKMCLLLLKTATKERTVYAIRVHLKNCSVGFILDHSEGVCKCDSKLINKLNGLRCDISKKTFHRPPSSWIGSVGGDLSFTSDCRLDYCLEYSSSVELSKPDEQCISGRGGMACGKCKKGLSVVFGTSQCKECTNDWLFLIPVFAIAGFLLVGILFLLNLTVVNGDINGYILMTNGLSIYSTRVLPSANDAPWMLVALSNLDLGIEVCFYDGMTAYAATWLRLVFPFYVLLIVVAMSFASRYIQIIERITRKRVIPVIATLYLLSYGKILQVTCRVLFSYTTIYHLNTGDTELYWSLDRSVQIFGLKFLLLFIFCLILFLFLIIPTNVLLIAGKSAYRFKIVTKYLKPFLDAYEAPFKENCRYILGIEFLLRAAIYSASSFDPRNIAAIYSGVVLIYTVYVCQVKPFKSRFNSILYSSYLLYMGINIILFVRFYPHTSKTYKVMFNLIFYISFVQFLGIIAIHVWKYQLHHCAVFAKCENFVKKKNNQLNAYISKSSMYISMDSLTLSASRYENFQEELLGLEANV